MPLHADLKAIITMNLIQDNKTTHNDINMAEIVFGKSNGEIKGKTVRRNSTLQQHIPLKFQKN